ncbi:hypothetical protein DL767_003696 [Monosporascus sp. MG133]|nr:hypothetical protein DL767_003696 [Monosporascus sp. MG133]
MRKGPYAVKGGGVFMQDLGKSSYSSWCAATCPTTGYAAPRTAAMFPGEFWGSHIFVLHDYRPLHPQPPHPPAFPSLVRAVLPTAPLSASSLSSASGALEQQAVERGFPVLGTGHPVADAPLAVLVVARPPHLLAPITHCTYGRSERMSRAALLELE